MLGSAVTPADVAKRPHDGYAAGTKRADTMPQPVTLQLGALPAKIEAVLVQMFLDDFQSPVWKSQFQVSLNGTRISSFERAVNSLQQTGPIGKLVTLKLMPEYWPLLRTGTVKLLIDDPTTHSPDGYAIDFVRILINPHATNNLVTIRGSVLDAKTRAPIPGATVEAALANAATDAGGRCILKGVPAGLVIARAIAPGYEEGVLSIDLVAGQTGDANFLLRRHEESTADLERSIAQTGSAAVYGIHFDVNSATLRSDSTAALNAILSLINGRAGSRWVIAGHTDNQGTAALNQRLSEARAASVAAWLTAHGIATDRMKPQGFGASRPVADNATDNGRALNRRVEIAIER
jgi:outer membrane protein OmpA-like peptidoglycan-associated protein